MLKKVHLSDMRKGRLYLPVGKGVFHAEPTAAAQLFFARENRLHITGRMRLGISFGRSLLLVFSNGSRLSRSGFRMEN